MFFYGSIYYRFQSGFPAAFVNSYLELVVIYKFSLVIYYKYY